jgi:predicted CXXCH cytochrome family protein
MRALALLVSLVSLALPFAALAAGGHDSVRCTGCHSLLDPKTKQPYTASTALCLACHAETDQGGRGYLPVSRHTSHPFGLATINPKVARVPAQLLREGGRFECMGCHDPHPSNPNFKYLRVDVGNTGEKMEAFCAVCHGSKADAAAEKLVLFDSMDEAHAPAASPAPPAAGKPGRK